MELQKVTFKKSQKMLPENLHERPPIHSITIHSISMVGYGGLCNRRIKYIVAIVRTELCAREASSFCDF